MSLKQNDIFFESVMEFKKPSKIELEDYQAQMVEDEEDNHNEFAEEEEKQLLEDIESATLPEY